MAPPQPPHVGPFEDNQEPSGDVVNSQKQILRTIETRPSHSVSRCYCLLTQDSFPQPSDLFPLKSIASPNPFLIRDDLATPASSLFPLVIAANSQQHFGR